MRWNERDLKMGLRFYDIRGDWVGGGKILDCVSLVAIKKWLKIRRFVGFKYPR